MYQDCLNNDLGLCYDKIKHRKILEHKISLKIFAQKCSNDELGLTLIFLWQD